MNVHLIERSVPGDEIAAEDLAYSLRMATEKARLLREQNARVLAMLKVAQGVLEPPELATRVALDAALIPSIEKQRILAAKFADRSAEAELAVRSVRQAITILAPGRLIFPEITMQPLTDSDQQFMVRGRVHGIDFLAGTIELVAVGDNITTVQYVTFADDNPLTLPDSNSPVVFDLTGNYQDTPYALY